MEILLTGGTGYIGTAVLARLLANGHEVTAVVRSDASAAAVQELGATPLQGDLSDTDWVRHQLDTVQGAIHTAAGGDADDAALDDAVAAAVIRSFGGTDKPYLHTGGVWTYGDGTAIDETTPANPPAITSWRLAAQDRLLAADVHASVVQPGIVYGHGTGIPSVVLGGPKDADGALVLAGPGDQHWTTIHVDDLADLYLAVLDAGFEGLVIGASGDNPTVREIGEAAGPVVAGSADELAERVGAPFAEALLLDQQTTAATAKGLGWTPSRPTLVELVAKGYPETD